MKKRKALRNNQKNEDPSESKKKQKLSNGSRPSLFDESEEVVEDNAESEEVSAEESDSEDDINLTKNSEEEMESFTFEFNDMKEDYFHGIKILLSQWISSLPEQSALSDIIVKQGLFATIPSFRFFNAICQ